MLSYGCLNTEKVGVGPSKKTVKMEKMVYKLLSSGVEEVECFNSVFFICIKLLNGFYLKVFKKSFCRHLINSPWHSLIKQI